MSFEPAYDVPAKRHPYTETGDSLAEHGRVGVLMLHGFLGSPLSSRPLARYLADHGITIHCPLLPGHGHHPDKLKGFTRQDWIDVSEDAFATLRSQCDELFLMGHSMGCVLGARLCLKYPDVRGLVMLTPVYESPDRRLHLMKVLKFVMPWFYPAKMPSRKMKKLVAERVADFDPSLDLEDPAVQKQIPHLTRIPTASLVEMLKMVAYGRALWPQLTTPSIIFHGGNDPAVKAGSIKKLYDVLPGPDKQIKKFPDAGHELMRPFDPVHEIVWKMTFDFIFAHSALKEPTNET